MTLQAAEVTMSLTEKFWAFKITLHELVFNFFDEEVLIYLKSLILIYIFIFMKFVYSIKNYRIFPYFGFIIFFILSQPLAIIIYNNIKKITKDGFIAGTNEMISLNIIIPIIVIILLLKISK